MASKKNANAVALGRLGGQARAESLSKSERSEAARKAARARSEKLTATERRRIAMLGVKARVKKQKRQSNN
jgi:hypothetical protein